MKELNQCFTVIIFSLQDASIDRQHDCEIVVQFLTW